MGLGMSECVLVLLSVRESELERLFMGDSPCVGMGMNGSN